MSVKSKSGSYNTYRRNLLIVILVIVLVAASLFAYTMIMNNDSNHVKTEAELINAIDKAPYEKHVTIIIDNDITLSRGTLVIPAGKNITLASKSNVEIFKLISATSYTTLGVTGELILDGLCITHTTGTTGMGAGISTGGAFTMYNSEILNNNAGGVSNSGTFKMYSGTISNNAGGSAGMSVGGVFNGGTFEMHGGKISNNAVETTQGGGVYNRGTFIMSGGEISDNTAKDSGGGVANWSSGIFEMSGGKTSDNTAPYDGGVNNWSYFNMTGGTITHNTAELGGGVYNSGTFKSSGGTISGNSAAHHDDDVYNNA
jgi:hypothetical protein